MMIDGDSIEVGKLNIVASSEGFVFTPQRSMVSLWK